jgi:glutaredoxin-like protein
MIHQKEAEMSEVLQESSAPAGAITMYATRWCGDCRRARRWFDAHGISYDVIDIDRDGQAATYVMQVNGGMRSVPTIVFPDESVLVEPTSRELEARCFQIGERAKSETRTKSKHGRLSAATKEISSPRFAAFYNWMMGRPLVRRMFDPLRRETAGQAHGIVLEVGAGGGQNFPFYDPARVVRVEAVELDEAMLVEARRARSAAPVPITLTRAPVEALPFPDAHFESIVVTLVLCSVQDPERGLREIWRVLKPGGTLLLLEHVRSQGKITAWIQGALVPVTTRCMGHCHWNRDTLRTVLQTGFQTTQVRQLSGGLQPMLLIHARRPQTQEEMKACKE